MEATTSSLSNVLDACIEIRNFNCCDAIETDINIPINIGKVMLISNVTRICHASEARYIIHVVNCGKIRQAFLSIALTVKL